MTDPATFLRPISTAAKALSAPVRRENSDHDQFHRYRTFKLSRILKDLEDPLRRLSNYGPNLNKEDTDELQAVAKEVAYISKTMASPSMWKRLVFWKQADGRSVLKQFSQDLTDAADCAQRAQEKFAAHRANKPYATYNHDYVENELQPLEVELTRAFKSVRDSHEFAEEFFSGWVRGKGFSKKQRRSKEITS